jgi:uncharacterized protein (DUF1800 family)
MPETSPLTATEARHLLRRSGFGAPPNELARFVGQPRDKVVDQLVGFKPARFKPRGRSFRRSHDRWIRFLLRGKPLLSKLVLFWHDHFATGSSKVDNPKLMANQIQLLHRLGKGSFRDLVKAINRDAAMMEFLDTVRNRKRIPNENYARELLELFTLGVYDFAGQPNYAQEDIVQIARAFTGWRYDDRRGDPYLDEEQHDYNAQFFATRGAKSIFASTGGFAGPQPFDAGGEGAPEIDTVVDIVFAHTDSEGQNTVARRTARRLLEYFAHPEPATSFVDRVVAASGFAGSWSIEALLRAIFVDDEFYATAGPPAAGVKKSVKWPIDYVISTLRTLGVKLKGREQRLEGGEEREMFFHVAEMGQVLLDPPSVFGWDWETAWLSSATLLARYSFARDLCAARGGGRTSFRPERLIDLGLTDPGAIVDAVTDLLGVTGELIQGERDVFINYLTDNNPGASINLSDPGVQDRKLRGLFALVLESPAYQLH